MARSTLAAAAAALPVSLLSELGKARAAVLPQAMIADAISGVVAFVIPGTSADPYSVQQGLTSATAGGVEANAVLPLMFGLNAGGLAPPPFDTLSELIAYLLGDITTTYVNPAPAGPFGSPFANLSFGEKAAVFSIMESPAAGLGAVVNSLLVYAGLMSYSEAGVLDPATGALVAPPVGWNISKYDGVFDGRNDFKGYYRGYRTAQP